ncbi:MAG: flagellin [Myxococcota bacterium]
MTLVINTNIASLNAQRALARSNQSLSTSFQRLSTGLRINSASDDAAGLAISARFTAQIRGINQGIRNANDGISLAQTTEAALNEVTSSLQRLRELAVQSANDTNSASDRAALQSEADQLIAEIDRVATQTTFNGRFVLNGDLSASTGQAAVFQVGANNGDTISVNIASSRANQIGRQASDSFAVDLTGNALGDNDLQVIGADGAVSFLAADFVNLDQVSTAQADESAIAVAAAINAASSTTGVRAEASATTVTGGAVGGGTLDGTNFIEINGVRIQGVVAADDTTGVLVNAINAVSSQTGVSAALDSSDQVVLTAEDGRNVDVVAGGTGATITGLAAATTGGSVTLSSDEAFSVGAGTGGDFADFSSTAAASVAIDPTVNIQSLSLTTQTDASSAIDTVDVALRQVTSQQADLGAILNRFQSTVSALSAVSENLSAARSRIQDADFAAETAEFTRNQILQQASTSILAQANVSTQVALSLLG